MTDQAALYEAQQRLARIQDLSGAKEPSEAIFREILAAAREGQRFAVLAGLADAPTLEKSLAVFDDGLTTVYPVLGGALSILTEQEPSNYVCYAQRYLASAMHLIHLEMKDRDEAEGRRMAAQDDADWRWHFLPERPLTASVHDCLELSICASNGALAHTSLGFYEAESSRFLNGGWQEIPGVYAWRFSLPAPVPAPAEGEG